jgi:branched-chain amino acid aminotransferase
MALVPFDDRDGFIWWDGEFVPWRDAKLHVLSHGLHYASAVFEGERCYSGNIFKLREHPSGC